MRHGYGSPLRVSEQLCGSQQLATLPSASNFPSVRLRLHLVSVLRSYGTAADGGDIDMEQVHLTCKSARPDVYHCVVGCCHAGARPMKLLRWRVSCGMQRACCHCRVWEPIWMRRRYWEVLLVSPRFLLAAPRWLAATTYLAALTGSCCVSLSVLLTSQLRLLFRGQSYIDSLKVVLKQDNYIL
jgi:hypothetical protein